MRLTYVICQNSSGQTPQTNWSDNYALDKSDIENNILKNWVNPKFSAVAQPTVPNPTNSGFVPDTRIRFKLDTILYIANDSLYPSNHVLDPNTLYDNFIPAQIKATSIVVFNMHYVHNNPTNVGLPATPNYYYGEAFSTGPFLVLWGNTAPLFDPNFILAHELGHTLGLVHTWCDDTTKNGVYCDYDTLHGGIYDTPAEIVPCPSTTTCPNNLMGPDGPNRDYLSPYQIAPMRKRIYTSLTGLLQLNTNSWIETAITQNTTYTGVTIARTGIRVKSGNTLTVVGTLNMPPYSKLIVEPNARLILDCGVITGYGGIWKGVILLGQNYAPQDTTLQGKLIMKNNSIIAHALDGVRNYEDACNPSTFSGGIIVASQSSFLNNVRDVGLQGYSPDPPGFTLPFFNNHSYHASFSSVTFKRDQFYLNPDNYFRESAFNVDGVQGVSFVSCKFNFGTSFNRSLVHAPIALMVTNGGVNMSAGSNNFQLYNKAIVIRNTQPRYIGSQIHRSTFFYNHSCITNEGGFAWNIFSKSTFNITYETAVNQGGLAYQMPYGIYVKNNMGAFLVANTLRGTAPNSQKHAAGIVLNNIGETNMSVQFNNFQFLTLASQAIGNNRSTNGAVGAEYHCNTFGIGRDYDIQVLPTNLIAPSPNDGIKKNQGSPGTQLDPPKTFELAGNLFNSPNPFHFHNFGAATPIQYNHHDSATAPQVVPVNRNNVNAVDHGVGFSATTSCPIPLKKSTEGDTLGEFDYPASQAHADVLLYDDEADSLQVVRTALVDGGNTWQLEAEILYAANEDNYILYTDLMNQSPYLSEGPIQELIERPGFPDIMLRNILIANPHVGREPWVIEQLGIHHPNMPQYMVDDIINGTATLDGLDYLDAAISRARSKQVFAAQVAIKDVVENPGESPFTAVQNILATLPYSNYGYIRVELYQQNGQFAEADQLLADMPTDLGFSANTEMMETHSHYLDWFGFKEGMYTDSLAFCSLDGENVTTLQGFVNNNDMTGAWARSAMATYFGYEINYPVYIPEEGSYKKENTYNFPNVPRPVQSLYPNPATDLIHVNLELKTSVEDIRYFIYDMKGVPVQTGQLYSTTDVIKLIKLASGQYIISFGSEAEAVHTEKLIVK